MPLTVVVYLYSLVYMRYKKNQQNKVTGSGNTKLQNKIGLLLVALLLVMPAVFAEMDTTSFSDPFSTAPLQAKMSDQELARFGYTLIKVQEIQMEANQKIDTSLQQTSLPIDRLDELYLIQQEDASQLEEEATAEEIAEYSDVMTTIGEIHSEAETQIMNSLEQNSFSVEEFNHTAAKIQDDPELIQRLQMLFDSRQEGI